MDKTAVCVNKRFKVMLGIAKKGKPCMVEIT
jgi:hypothetical protein